VPFYGQCLEISVAVESSNNINWNYNVNYSHWKCVLDNTSSLSKSGIALLKNYFPFFSKFEQNLFYICSTFLLSQ
jgi:hypothetical protein